MFLDQSLQLLIKLFIMFSDYYFFLIYYTGLSRKFILLNKQAQGNTVGLQLKIKASALR